MLRFLYLSFLVLFNINSASAGRHNIEMFYHEEFDGINSFEVNSFMPIQHVRIHIPEFISFENPPSALKKALESQIEECHEFYNFGFIVLYSHVNQMLYCVADFLTSEEGKDFEWYSDNANQILQRSGVITPPHLNVTLPPEEIIKNTLSDPSEERLISLFADEKTLDFVELDVINALGEMVKSPEDFRRIVVSINSTRYRATYPPNQLKVLSEQGFKIFSQLNRTNLRFYYSNPKKIKWDLVVDFYKIGGRPRAFDFGAVCYDRYKFKRGGSKAVEGICNTIMTGNVSNIAAVDRAFTISDIQRIIDASKGVDTPRDFNFFGNNYTKEEAEEFKKQLPEGFKVHLARDRW